MVRKLDALVDDPSRKSVFHTRFAGQDPPLACIEAPVTEFDVTILKDMEFLPVRERLAESIMSHMRTTHLEGFLSMARGIALEDVLTNVYLAGWNSIEVRASRLSMGERCVDTRVIGEIGPYEARLSRESQKYCERARGDLPVLQGFANTSCSFRTTCLTYYLLYALAI